MSWCHDMAVCQCGTGFSTALSEGGRDGGREREGEKERQWKGEAQIQDRERGENYIHLTKMAAPQSAVLLCSANAMFLVYSQ